MKHPVKGLWASCVVASALCCALAAACGGSSTPSAPSARPPSNAPTAVTAMAVSASGGSIFGASVVDLARCLQSSGDAVCFSGARPVERTAVAGATAPGAPGTLTATSTGSSVTLTWSAPASGDPVVTYIIEAGSASGLSNLAVVTTNSTETTFSAGGVGNGTYYVRIKAQNATGASAPSDEAILVVGPAACTSAPNAPGGLSSTVSGRAVTLSWNAPSAGCAPTSYMLQAGSTSGSSALANSSVGNVSSFVATGLGNGTYYIRVVAANAFGQSAASNEVVATVAGPAGALSVTYTPNPTPYNAHGSCTAGNNAWTYSEAMSETNGVGLTITLRSYTVDGRAGNTNTSIIAIPARGSVTFSTSTWCLSGSGPYSVQTTYSGTDANGSRFSYAGPLVSLQAKPGVTTNKRAFPAVWITASWSGGRTGTPLSSRGIDPLTHFGTLCLANSITLKNHPDPEGSFFHSDDSLFATNTGCSAAMTTVAFCRTSGSGGGASSIPICATDPRETPLSGLRIVAVSRAGVGTWIGTTPINFDVNVFWCSDTSTFNYDGRVRGVPLTECVEN